MLRHHKGNGAVYPAVTCTTDIPAMAHMFTGGIAGSQRIGCGGRDLADFKPQGFRLHPRHR